MKDSVEYQIFIGCNDSQLSDEIINKHELIELVSMFFARKQVDFSMLSAKGGYLQSDGSFVTENTLCINLIGDYDLDILKLVKSLSMFMNQECSLIIKNTLKTEFR